MGLYDGDVVIWLRDIGQVYCILNVNKGFFFFIENINKIENK